MKLLFSACLIGFGKYKVFDINKRALKNNDFLKMNDFETLD
jgi:hypothetical protein